MNKTQVKALVAPQIQIIQATAPILACTYWARSKALQEIAQMIVWKKSPYISFSTFCKEELPFLNMCSIKGWTWNYRSMSKYYTWQEIEVISKSLTYSQAARVIHLSTTVRRLPIKQFIAKGLLTVKPAPAHSNKVTNESKILLHLSRHYIEKLQLLLQPYGFVIPANKSIPNYGISNAMAKYLDTI